MGTAIRTLTAPTVFTSEFDDSAVYACDPPAIYSERSEDIRWTSYLLVASFRLGGNTVVYPCDAAGQMVWWLITEVMACDHAAALKAAGYDLEVVSRRGA